MRSEACNWASKSTNSSTYSGKAMEKENSCSESIWFKGYKRLEWINESFKEFIFLKPFELLRREWFLWWSKPFGFQKCFVHYFPKIFLNFFVFTWMSAVEIETGQWKIINFIWARVDIFWSFAKFKPYISKHTNQLIESFHVPEYKCRRYAFSIQQPTWINWIFLRINLDHISVCKQVENISGVCRYNIECKNTIDGSIKSIHIAKSTIWKEFDIQTEPIDVIDYGNDVFLMRNSRLLLFCDRKESFSLNSMHERFVSN